MTAALTVLHRSRERLRLRCPALRHRRLDPLYLQALLENVPGVRRVRINSIAASVTVWHEGDATLEQRVRALLDPLPQTVFTVPQSDQESVNPLTVVGLGVLAVFLRGVPPSIQGGISLMIALPTLLKGIDTLLDRGIKIDVLDAGAVAISLARRDYFTANMIVFLLRLGEYFEYFSQDKTSGLLRTLLRPQVDRVWVEQDGVEIELPLDRVEPGQTILCGSGEMIPIDGRVVHGEASVNQSSITGESVPVHKKAGDAILSGAVVEEGRLAIRVDAVGSETGLARINLFLQQSLRSSSETQRHSEQLAERLVPITLGLAGVIFLLTRDIRRTAAALTVDYSCAIKLATPITVRTAMYAAAHQGALIKGAATLDRLAAVDTLVFDKTGTLTEGRLQVTDVVPLTDLSPRQLLALAASAEEHYAHPIAEAVVGHAAAQGIDLLPISRVDFIVAHGVSAYVDGQQVLVGSRHFIHDDEGIECRSASVHEERLHGEGKSLLYIARGQCLEGVIALRDTLRKEASQVLNALKDSQRRLVVLTGDHEQTAKALHRQLPQIDAIHWQLKPQDKATLIKQLQQQGRNVAFVGDGVNDAPALVTADVGISMPSGADLARDAAQVILIQDDLNTLLHALEIADRAKHTLSEGFYAAVGGNSLFLLGALSGRIAPVTAALLHNLLTVSILGWSASRSLTFHASTPVNPVSGDRS
ncbi:heavy metal translocating P-type ATPase [uncultured Desulfuromonas sp.]|uniref:heavy metal translocating P-type ATPase n=1 Tax=uncultured Desulfuromonas sp. TaxID=181013 RepID=UPI002AAA9D57|nr:heavy metal translocating P-type ATPase [uncultured Desulfuromonas sp.]